MLIRFRVKNFLSFFEDRDGKPIEFSMIANSDDDNRNAHFKGNLNVLKFAAVYGANAAGKSNLIQAMKFLQDTVLMGSLPMTSGSYCKTDLHNKEKESYFEVELEIEGRFYAYGYEAILDRAEFVSEWLTEIFSNGEEQEIFVRDIPNKICRFSEELCSEEDIKNKLDVYADDMKNNSKSLLLKMMNENKDELYAKSFRLDILRKVFGWICSVWEISRPQEPLTDYSNVFHDKNADEFKQLVQFFSLGIMDIKIVDAMFEDVFWGMPSEIKERLRGDVARIVKRVKEDSKVDSGQIVIRNSRGFFVLTVDGTGEIKCEKMRLVHDKPDILFDLPEESDGTVRLLDLLEVLMSKESKTFVVDELDRCLHPSLTYQFVKEYLKRSGKKDIQLIVTTHESRLLDFSLLKKDEIWFVDKNREGTSRIYPLSEYNDRFDKCIDKAYLEGRYGGVPIFTTLFPVEETK